MSKMTYTSYQNSDDLFGETLPLENKNSDYLDTSTGCGEVYLNEEEKATEYPSQANEKTIKDDETEDTLKVTVPGDRLTQTVSTVMRYFYKLDALLDKDVIITNLKLVQEGRKSEPNDPFLKNIDNIIKCIEYSLSPNEVPTLFPV